MTNWDAAVMGAITGRIAGWIARQRLDRLTAPVDQDPRAAIRLEFTLTEARRQLANLGAELVWFNIGHLDLDDEVDQQRLDNWKSFWQGQDSVNKAQGEALRAAYEELGRAEGQAAMLQAIIAGLQADTPAYPVNERAVELALLRVGYVLEAMTNQPGLSLTEGTVPAKPKSAANDHDRPA